MTSWMLLSCLYLFVVRMLRSLRDSLTLADIHVSAGCEPEVNRRLTGPWGVALLVPVQEDKNLSLQVLGTSSLSLQM